MSNRTHDSPHARPPHHQHAQLLSRGAHILPYLDEEGLRAMVLIGRSGREVYRSNVHAGETLDEALDRGERMLIEFEILDRPSFG